MLWRLVVCWIIVYTNRVCSSKGKLERWQNLRWMFEKLGGGGGGGGGGDFVA